MAKQRGVSAFWLDIKALENHRTHLIGELGPKEGMLVFGVWVRIFTWQYMTASPIKDAQHLARLTNLHIHKCRLLWQLLPQLLPRSLIRSPHGLLCQRTMETLKNYNKSQLLTGAQSALKVVGDSYSYSDSKKEEEEEKKKQAKKKRRSSQREQGQSPRQQGTNPRKLSPLAEPLAVDGVDMDAWAAYEAYRRERRLSKLKPASVTRLQRWLVEQADQGAVIDQTIRNGWIGLFELKAKHEDPKPKNGSGRPQSFETMVENLGAELRMPAKPGEAYREYYDRLLRAKREGRATDDERVEGWPPWGAH